MTIHLHLPQPIQPLVCYKTMPVWTVDTIPPIFKQKHNTKQGTWAKINILQGSLKLYVLTETGEEIEHFIFHAGENIPFVAPRLWHKIEPLTADFQGYLEFCCTEQDYPSKI